MADILRFPGVIKKEEPIFTGGNKAETVCTSEVCLQLLEARHRESLNTVRYIDSYAGMLFGRIPLVSGVMFAMDNESLKKAVQDGITPDSYWFEYLSTPIPVFHAMIRFSFSIDRHPDIGQGLVLKHNEDGTVDVADPESRSWLRDENIETAFHVMEKGGAMADILKVLAREEGILPYEVTQNAFYDICEANEKTVNLFLKTNRFTDVVYEIPCNDNAKRLILIPKSGTGGAMFCQPDGGYVVLLRTANMTDVFSPRVIWEGSGKADGNEVERICRFLFDHYGDDDILRLPISPDAYLEMTDSGSGVLRQTPGTVLSADEFNRLDRLIHDAWPAIRTMAD